jgi:hypothetical protein
VLEFCAHGGRADCFAVGGFAEAGSGGGCIGEVLATPLGFFSAGALRAVGLAGGVGVSAGAAVALCFLGGVLVEVLLLQTTPPSGGSTGGGFGLVAGISVESRERDVALPLF